MQQGNKGNMTIAFNNLLESLVEGKTYKGLPPRGPIDLSFASIENEQLEALNQDVWGQDETEPIDNDSEKITKLMETSTPKIVKIPKENQLDGLNVIGITGDNKRILTTSFHLILSRASIVNFRYTKGFEKPYFYNKKRDASSLLVLDNNIFESSYGIHTYNELVNDPDGPLLDHISKNSENKPFRFKYNHEKSKKAPSSQSLGLAVKFQHTQELACIDDIDFQQNGITVCLKQGPIFSNSTKLSDIRLGLQKLLSWKKKNRFYIGISSKVSESRVLIKTLLEHNHVIEEYFPNQNITEGVIKSFGTDSLLLKKILTPGTRTPMIEYIEKTREGALNTDALKGLKPVTCYYHKRSKPYGFVRVEMPKFMWEEDKEMAEFAVSIAVWQYELEGTMPLVIKAASDQSSLQHEKWVVEQQMKAAFEKKDLELIEFLNLS
jgi:hypothetical protein